MKTMPPAEYWGVDRIVIDDETGETMPTCVEAIQPGDWITHYTLRYPLMGRVVSRVTLCPGKLDIDGFIVECYGGRRDFIEADQAMIMGLRYQEA